MIDHFRARDHPVGDRLAERAPRRQQDLLGGTRIEELVDLARDLLGEGVVGLHVELGRHR